MCLFVYFCDLYVLLIVYLYFAFILAACNLPFYLSHSVRVKFIAFIVIYVTILL